MHLGVEYWLDQLRLSEYLPQFSRFHDVQEFLYIDEETLRNDIGIKHGGHRASIMTSLVLLRTKYNLKKASKSLEIDNYSLRNARSRSMDFAQFSFPVSRTSRHISASTLNIAKMPDLDQPEHLTEAESLRRQLEWELSLDESRLESYAWYHGPIPRPHAELLLKNEGDFLLRDSSTGQPGDLVLSTFWNGGHLHFMIAKVVIQPHTVYASIQYRLEDEPFETVPDLVRFYVGSNRALTVASGAKITTPINRSQPLSLYATRYTAENLYQHPMSPSSVAQNLYCGSATLGRTRMVHPTSREFTTNSLPRSNKGVMKRHPSEPILDERIASPPPKPSRVPSIRRPEKTRSEENKLVKASSLSRESCVDEADETLGEAGDVVPQLPSQATTLPRLRKVKRPRPVSDTRDSFLDPSNDEVDGLEISQSIAAHENLDFQLLEEGWNARFPSLFNLESFKTPLLPPGDFKPLEIQTLEEMSMLFESHSPKSIALHLLQSDLDIFGGLPDPVPENIKFYYFDYFRSRGLSSGLDLCTMPNGKQYRNDLLERTNSLRLFVACTVLTCPTAEDRCALLNMWISIAIESKTALGNMYGYLNIVSALSMPQIQRLASTWGLLRQHHTSNACTFEAQLRPHKKSQVTPHPPNTTVPDLLSAVLLWQASTAESFLCDEEDLSISRLNLNLPNAGSDFGLDCFASHLTLMRSWSSNLPLYLRNSSIALDKFQPNKLLLDVFRTEFQMKFLWGNRVISSAADLRYDKFEQVLCVLSERCEPPL